MMAFITACWKNLRISLCALLGMMLLSQVHAAAIVLQQVNGSEHDGRLSVDGRFEVSLDPVHEAALFDGVPLSFVVEFNLTRPRWLWAWRRTGNWFGATASIEYRLVYHPLSRSYRVSTGTLYHSYDSLAQALHALGVLREWQVGERGAVTRRLGSQFAGELSMRLDTSKLPKPMQLSLLTERDWVLESEARLIEFNEVKQDTKMFEIKPSEIKSAEFSKNRD